MEWDYELAQALRPSKKSLQGMEGKVVSTSPLTISLLGGEVMAPPAPLAVANGDGIRWKVGDQVVCIWMGKTLVVLGRLGG